MFKKWNSRIAEVVGAVHVDGCAPSATSINADSYRVNRNGATEQKNAIQTLVAKLSVYACVGMATVAATPAKAFAASGSLDITNISSILDFLGNICVVVGVVLAGWNVVQAAQTAKETQGLQIDRSFWGIIGGIGIAVGGGAIKTAGSLWNYGTAG